MAKVGFAAKGVTQLAFRAGAPWLWIDVESKVLLTYSEGPKDKLLTRSSSRPQRTLKNSTSNHL